MTVQTVCGCKKIPRVAGLYHSKFCKNYPNCRVGTEHLLDNARAGNLRAEIHKHAQRVAQAHDWNHCQLADCSECRYIAAHIDDADDDDSRGMVLP